MFSAESAVRRATQSVCTALAVVLLAAIGSPSALAIPANPMVFQQAQPDGTVIALRVRGDEHFNWAEDLEGYTVVHHLGWYEYARLNPQGRLIPTGLKVGLNNPKANGLKTGLLPTPQQRAASAKKSTATSATSAETAVSAAGGTLKNLVVLVRFSNHVFQ